MEAMNSPKIESCSSSNLCSLCKKGKKPGVLHIFNQNKFDEKLKLKIRTGSENDVKELENTFKLYHLKTYRHDDFTVQKIRRTIKQISKTDFSENSCIVVVFLSHGFQNNVIAAKDRPYCFDEMILRIQSNETLKSKPKIFIIQACRDGKANKLYKECIKTNFNTIKPDYLNETYVLNSSSELLTSYRSEGEGSIFIQYFCHFLNEFGSKKSIDEIFDLVNILIQNRYNQLPEMKRNTGAPYTFGDYCKFFDEQEQQSSVETNGDENEQQNPSNEISKIEQIVTSQIQNLAELELSESDEDDFIAPIKNIIENVSEVLEFAKETDRIVINKKIEQFITDVKSLDVDKWVKQCFCGHTPIPKNIIKAGVDLDGEPIYIGRANFNHELLPAKVFLERQQAFVSTEGREYKLTDYEILVGTGYSWVPASRGFVPSNAVKGGVASNGEILYIGRTSHDTTVTPGKIQPSHGFLYIPFDGLEVRFFHYEVLVKIEPKNE